MCPKQSRWGPLRKRSSTSADHTIQEAIAWIRGDATSASQTQS